MPSIWLFVQLRCDISNAELSLTAWSIVMKNRARIYRWRCLSSGEAEYFGVVKGASALLGALSLCKDLGVPMKGRIHTDSSAAKGIASRRGLGKTLHIGTQFLWVQERLQAGSFTLHKESTADSVGDLFTKHLDATKSADFTARLGYSPREGTSALTLRAA